MPVTNRVQGPYCKLWPELVADLWPKREASYFRTVSGYSAGKTDMTLCWYNCYADNVQGSTRY